MDDWSRQLHEIQRQMSALAREAPSEVTARELAVIRASLRQLAEDNEEIRRRLGSALGPRGSDEAADDDSGTRGASGLSRGDK